MSGDLIQSGGQALGQGQSTSQPPAQTQAQNQQGSGVSQNATTVTLSPEQLSQLAEMIFADRGKQMGLYQHTDAQLGKMVDAKMAELQAAGIRVTPDQARSLVERQQGQQNVSQGTLAQQAQDEQPEISSETGDQELDPVVQDAVILMQEANIFIGDDDPELALVDQKTDRPSVFLKSVEKAIAAKAQRLQKEGSSVGLPGAVVQGSGGGGLPQNLRPMEYFDMAYKPK